MDNYLTTADALAYLKTTQRTLYRRLANGDIPAVRMGHQWRFRKSDLDRWIEKQSLVRPAAHEATQTAAPVDRPRVLVADDDPDVLDTLAEILAMTDCAVDTVADGRTAVERLRVSFYHLVVTDLMMPGLDGIAVSREAKRLWPAIKVIIVTAYPSQSTAIDAVNIGVDGYVTKPFRPIDVLMATARALNLTSPDQQHVARDAPSIW